MAAKSNKRPRTKTARSGKKKGTVKKNQENTYIREEVLILCSLAACILLMISNFGLGGMAGKMVSSVMFGIFGWMAYAVPIFLFGAVAFLSSNSCSVHFSNLSRTRTARAWNWRLIITRRASATMRAGCWADF